MHRKIKDRMAKTLRWTKYHNTKTTKTVSSAPPANVADDQASSSSLDASTSSADENHATPTDVSSLTDSTTQNEQSAGLSDSDSDDDQDILADVQTAILRQSTDKGDQRD